MGKTKNCWISVSNKSLSDIEKKPQILEKNGTHLPSI